MNAKGKGLWWISPLAMAVALAACGGDSDNDRPATGGDDGDGFQASPLLVMHNGSGNAGRIDWVDGIEIVLGLLRGVQIYEPNEVRIETSRSGDHKRQKTEITRKKIV